MIEKILEYFRHTSTWKGLFGLLTAVGVSVAPEYQEAVITVGLSLIGLIQVFIDDNGVTKSITKDSK